MYFPPPYGRSQGFCAHAEGPHVWLQFRNNVATLTDIDTATQQVRRRDACSRQQRNADRVA